MSGRRLGPFLLFAAALACACGRPQNRQAVDRFEYYFLDVYKPFFVRQDSPAGPVYGTRDPIGRPSQYFAVAKPKDMVRVFVLGGSVAQMYDLSAEVRPQLRDALQRLLPGRRVEVLNCGQSGYDLERAGVIFDEVLGYEPDLILVISGGNEWRRGMLPRWAVPVCRRKAFRGVCEAAVLRIRSSASGRPDRIRANFEGVMRRIARSARRAGVPLAVCTIPVSLRHMPPPGTLPLDDLTFFKGWLGFEEGRWEEARAGFQRRLNANPWDSMTRFYLARCEDLLGDFKRAREDYRAAQNVHRPLPMMNDATRLVSREEGTVLADLERLFETLSPQGIPGRDMLEDDVHWYRPLDRLATVEIVHALLESGLPSLGGLPRERWDGRWLASDRKRIMDEARASRPGKTASWSVFRFRMWEPLRYIPELFLERVIALMETIHVNDPDLLASTAGMKRWMVEQLLDNVWDKQSAARIDEWWPLLLGHAGEFYRRKGTHAKALEFFDEALRLQPSLVKVRLSRALTLKARGREKEAREEFSRLGPFADTPEARNWRKAYGL